MVNMKTHRLILLLILLLVGWILVACDDASLSGADPNVSGVQARATLEFVQAVQTSTAQALYAVEWQATVQAAATQDAIQAAYVAAQATDESIRAAAAATQTQQVWNATATADSSQATATAAANATAVSWSSTATQAAWNNQATAEVASVQALQTAQAAQADMACMAAERQRTINKVQAAAPWVILAIAVPLVAYLAWIWGNTEALRRRAIPRDPRGDAPILILDDHGHRNVIDPDLFFGAVVSIGKSGKPEAPMLSTSELQSQVKARDQAVDLVSRGLPGQSPRRRALPALTQPQSNPVLGNVRVVEPEEVKDWLSDVLPRIQRQALQEGAIEYD
jgi:chemotaxis protein histidine kinase CheA